VATALSVEDPAGLFERSPRLPSADHRKLRHPRAVRAA
jgi:hypothetical protein